MPALTQTMPTRTNGYTNGIPLNGFPTSHKLKEMLAKRGGQPENPLVPPTDPNATPVPPTDPVKTPVPLNNGGNIPKPDDPIILLPKPNDPDIPTPQPGSGGGKGVTKKSLLRETFDNDNEILGNAVSTASSAMKKVLEDLFREASANSDILVVIQNLSIKQTNIIGKLDNDTYNAGARSWNASIPDRDSPLRPLKAPQHFAILDDSDDIATIPEQNTIWGLNVSITQLEAFPDVIKAALLLHLGIEPVNIALPGLVLESGELDEDVLNNLRWLQMVANLMAPMNDRTEEEKAMSAGEAEDARLTKQLRVVMGLAPFAVAAVPAIPAVAAVV